MPRRAPRLFRAAFEHLTAGPSGPVRVRLHTSTADPDLSVPGEHAAYARRMQAEADRAAGLVRAGCCAWCGAGDGQPHTLGPGYRFGPAWQHHGPDEHADTEHMWGQGPGGVQHVVRRREAPARTPGDLPPDWDMLVRYLGEMVAGDPAETARRFAARHTARVRDGSRGLVHLDAYAETCRAGRLAGSGTRQWRTSQPAVVTCADCLRRLDLDLRAEDGTLTMSWDGHGIATLAGEIPASVAEHNRRCPSPLAVGIDGCGVCGWTPAAAGGDTVFARLAVAAGGGHCCCPTCRAAAAARSETDQDAIEHAIACGDDPAAVMAAQDRLPGRSPPCRRTCCCSPRRPPDPSTRRGGTSPPGCGSRRPVSGT